MAARAAQLWWAARPALDASMIAAKSLEKEVYKGEAAKNQ
jgi:hypothetical protein